jgi:hypothetical protein
MLNDVIKPSGFKFGLRKKAAFFGQKQDHCAVDRGARLTLNLMSSQSR